MEAFIKMAARLSKGKKQLFTYLTKTIFKKSRFVYVFTR